MGEGGEGEGTRQGSGACRTISTVIIIQWGEIGAVVGARRGQGGG